VQVITSPGSAVVVVDSVVVVVEVEVVVDAVVVAAVVVVGAAAAACFTSASLVFFRGFLKSYLEVVNFLAAVVGYRPAVNFAVVGGFIVLHSGGILCDREKIVE
jgi:FtsH-binding integral membrane protein